MRSGCRRVEEAVAEHRGGRARQCCVHAGEEDHLSVAGEEAAPSVEDLAGGGVVEDAAHEREERARPDSADGGADDGDEGSADGEAAGQVVFDLLPGSEHHDVGGGGGAGGEVGREEWAGDGDVEGGGGGVAVEGGEEEVDFGAAVDRGANARCRLSSGVRRPSTESVLATTPRMASWRAMRWRSNPQPIW